MWRIWMLFDPRRALIGLWIFLAFMALTIHFILLSTPRYDWFGSSAAEVSSLKVDTAISRLA